VIDGVKLGATFTSWVGSAEAVLRAAGFYDGDTTELMGQTAFAFHFQINPGACPSSVTTFPLTELPVYALDLLGVDSEAFQVNPGMQREAAMRLRAVERIKESIDRGIPAIVWAPTPVLEFGVVHGYDDADAVFDVKAFGPPGSEPDPLLYDNLGRGNVPILFYQLVHSREPVALAVSRRRALELAVHLWKPATSHPGRGEAAYGVLIDALERQDFIPFGLAYNLWVYTEAKRHAQRYLERLVEQKALGGLEPAREAYALIASAFARASERIPFRGPASKVETAVLPEVISLLSRSAEHEARARKTIEQALASASTSN
jgi:hypothetical protein